MPPQKTGLFTAAFALICSCATPHIAKAADLAAIATIRKQCRHGSTWLLYAFVFGETARPRNMSMAWLTRRMSSSSSLPIIEPSLVFGTVEILSTISRQGTCRPLPSLGCTGSRNSGASALFVVRPQIVMEFVASKLLSWTMTTGRGFPA
jgi:hypothetical protein